MGAGVDMAYDMNSPKLELPPVRVMKGPVEFRYAAASLISPTRDWVGIHQGNRLVFAEQKNADAEIVNYTLEPSINQEWELDPYSNCNNCLKLVPNFDFNKDYLIASHSLFYKITPGIPGASGFMIDQSIFEFRFIAMNRAIAGYRPFVHADFDGIIFQLGENETIASRSGSALFYRQSTGTTNIGINYDRVDLSNEKHLTYCVGDLDQLGTTLPQQEVLIFEGAAVADAYHIQVDKFNNVIMIRDDNLKELIAFLRDKINMEFKINPALLIRSIYIADLNKDKYADLLIGIANNIYVATYSPEISDSFILWKRPIVTLASNERPRSITVKDLNGDSYPDLAVEIFNSEPSDYRKDSPSKVAFYVNQQR